MDAIKELSQLPRSPIASPVPGSATLLLTNALLNEEGLNKSRAGSWRVDSTLVKDHQEVVKDKRNNRKEMTHTVFAILGFLVARAQG